MKFFLSSFLALMLGGALAQLPAPIYNGVIVDRDEQVIVSKLSHAHGFDAVVFKLGNSSSSSILSAHRVASFRYYDHEKNINRQFVSILQNGFHRFYEVVVYGEVQIVRRLKKFANSWEADEGHDYDFFISLAGEMYPLKKFESIVFPRLLHIYGEELAWFVNQNGLRLSKAASAFKVVKRCNELILDQRMVVTR